LPISRCEPQSNQTSEPAPFAPDTGAPTINIRRWGSMPGKGSGVPVGAPPTVRTAIEPNLRASPHSHPGRVLLQQIREFAPVAAAPTNAKESDAYPSHLLRIIHSVIPFLGALLQQFFFILVHIVLSFLIILCMGTGST